MKKLRIVIPALLFLMAMILPASAADRNAQNRGYQSDQGRRQGPRDQSQRDRDQGRNLSKSSNYYDTSRDRDYDYRHPEHRPSGYRRQPHGRNYSHPQLYRNHEYHYEGHWRSWDDWEKYKKRYPDRFRRGGYYKEDGHLFFRFCDPSGGSCFFFSIGR